MMITNDRTNGKVWKVKIDVTGLYDILLNVALGALGDCKCQGQAKGKEEKTYTAVGGWFFQWQEILHEPKYQECKPLLIFGLANNT
jgi:hypothetical protein